MASTVGLAPARPARVRRICRKRALSLRIVSPAARVAGGDQSVHVVSGVEVLPDLVWSRTSVPGGAAPSQERRPQFETVSVSLTFETKVPSVASVASKARSRAGFA